VSGRIGHIARAGTLLLRLEGNMRRGALAIVFGSTTAEQLTAPSRPAAVPP